MVYYIFIAIFILSLWLLFHRKRDPRLPPGIQGWPIIGSLPSFTLPLTEQIENYRNKFGDVFMWKIGSRNIVFICDPLLIKKAFNNSSLLDRPQQFFTFDTWSYNRKTGIVNSNGELWLDHRRFTLKQLKDSGYGRSRVEDIIRIETEILIKDFRDNYLNKPVEVPSSLNLSSMNVIWQLAADKRFDKGDPTLETFHTSLLKINEQIQGLVNILDIFPWLVPITPKFVLNMIGFGELQETWRIIKDYIKVVIAERRASLSKENPCGLIDAYLLEMDKEENHGLFEDDALVITLGDLFIAGSETTSSTIRWALQYMANHPDMQERAHKELDSVVPADRFPSLSDRQNLPYIEAIIHEILRITTIAPLGLFHAASNNTELEQFLIPKGTVVAAFLHGCHMNAKYWDKPKEFRPDRFLDSNGKLSGKNEAFMPFSIGRRNCLGENLARNGLFLFVSAILQRFSIHLPEGENVSFAAAQKPLIFSFPSKMKVIFKERNQLRPKLME